MAIKFNFNLKPQKAIDYLNNKGFKLSFDYDEMIGAVHHKSFTVAKVTRTDLLNDIFTSLNEANQSGVRFDEWLNDLKPTLQKKGWWGEKDIINPKTGEVKSVYIGSRRLRHIFNTNMRVGYNVQRYHSMKKLTLAVYWLYKSMFLPNSRDKHKALDGTLFHKDDPWLDTNYPPNDHGCKCKMRAYTKAQADKKGFTLSDDKKPNIASDDWAYNVGAGSTVGKLSQMKLGQGLKLLKPNKALDKLNDEQLKQRFYSTLAINEGDLFIDKVGDPMTVGDDLFKTAKGNSKIKKRDRHLYLDELAQTIADPDEIYIEVENRSGKSKFIKKMFRYFNDEKGKPKAVMGLFTYEKDKTVGTTLYLIDRAKVVSEKRIEKLIYQKEKQL